MRPSVSILAQGFITRGKEKVPVVAHSRLALRVHSCNILQLDILHHGGQALDPVRCTSSLLGQLAGPQ